jgi:Spy/CpxP family protein refolding chaperone
MSKRYYFAVILLFVGILFAFSAASIATPGDSPQEKAKENAPHPKGVSPAKPGIKPPIPGNAHGCGCCCCGHEKASGCKSRSKDSLSKLHLGAQHGKTITIEKCVGESAGHDGKEIKIICEQMPGSKHKIMRGTAKSHGKSCSSECMQTCGSGHGSEGMVWIGKGHKKACMSQCSPSGADHCGPDCMLMHASVLGLTDDQQDELRDLQFAMKKKMIDLKAALQKAQIEMQELMSEDDPNVSAIKRQLNAIAEAQTDLKFEMISTMITARNVLTEEQRELIKEKKQMHGGGCCEGHMDMGMQLIESCRPFVRGGHKTVDVYVDDDDGERVEIIEIDE